MICMIYKFGATQDTFVYRERNEHYKNLGKEAARAQKDLSQQESLEMKNQGEPLPSARSGGNTGAQKKWPFMKIGMAIVIFVLIGVIVFMVIERHIKVDSRSETTEGTTGKCK